MLRVSVTPQELCMLRVANLWSTKVNPSTKSLIKAVSEGNVNLEPDDKVYGETFIEINEDLVTDYMEDPVRTVHLPRSTIVVDVIKDHSDHLERYLRMLAISKAMNRPCLFISFDIENDWVYGPPLTTDEQLRLLGDVLAFVIRNQDSSEYLYSACGTYTNYIYYRDSGFKNLFRA